MSSNNIGSTRFTVSGTDSGQVERTLKEVRTDYAIIFKKLQSKEYINITDNSPTIKKLEDLLKECNSIHPKDGTLQILKEQIERLKVVVSTDWGTMKVKIVGDQTTWGNTTPLDNQSLVVWLNHTPGTEKFLTIKTKDSKGDLELNLSECKNGIAEKFHEFILNNLDDRYRNIVLSMRETVNITPVQQHEIELLKENISKYIKDNPSANTTVLSQLRSNVESLPNQIVDRLVVLKKYKEYCDAKFSSKFKSLTDSKVSQLNEQVAKAVAPRKVDENYRFLAHMLKTTREELRGFKRGGPIELTVDVLTTINIPQPVIKAFGLAKRINDGFVFSEDVCQDVQKLEKGKFYIVPIYVSRADSKRGHAMLMKIECTDTNSLGKKTYLITHFNTGDGVNEDNNHYRKTLENGANIYQLGTQVSGVSEDKLNQKFFEQVMNTSNQSRENFYRTLFSLGERSPPSNDPNLWGASQGLSGTCETSAIKALMRSVLTPEEYVLFELKAKTELLFRDIKVLKQGECDKTTEKIIALDAVKNISAYFEGETIGWLKELEQTLAFDEIVAKHKEGKDENLLGALSNLYSNVNQRFPLIIFLEQIKF